MENQKKAMLSQPMAGKTNDERSEERRVGKEC